MMIDESEEGAPEGTISLPHSKVIDNVLSVFSDANEWLKSHDPFPSFPFPVAEAANPRDPRGKPGSNEDEPGLGPVLPPPCNAIGGALGGAAGQALIPIPYLGYGIGWIFGSIIGGTICGDNDKKR